MQKINAYIQTSNRERNSVNCKMSEQSVLFRYLERLHSPSLSLLLQPRGVTTFRHYTVLRMRDHEISLPKGTQRPTAINCHI